MNCYICLEPTCTLIQNKCDCYIYSHVSCYEKWLNHKKVCLICKNEVHADESEIITCFSKFIQDILRIFLPFISNFIDHINRWFGILFFLVFSFVFTMLLIFPMYVLIAVSNIKTFRTNRYKGYKVRNINL